MKINQFDVRIFTELHDARPPYPCTLRRISEILIRISESHRLGPSTSLYHLQLLVQENQDQVLASLVFISAPSELPLASVPLYIAQVEAMRLNFEFMTLYCI